MGDNTDAAAKWTYLTGAHYNGATNSTGISLIGSYSNSTSNQVVIGGSIYEANPATEIQFWTYTATTHNLGGYQRMVIDTNGNVGIGTTSPSLSSGKGLHINSSSGHANIKLQSSGRVWELLSTTGAYFSIYDTTGGSDRFVVSSAGYVGIGTTSPDVLLHSIGGTTKLNKNAVKTTTGYSNADLVLGDDTSSRTGYSGNGSNLFLHANGKSTITFLDQTRNLSQISYSNSLLTIGEDVGWGTATVNIPGNAIITGSLTVTGTLNATVAPDFSPIFMMMGG